MDALLEVFKEKCSSKQKELETIDTQMENLSKSRKRCLEEVLDLIKAEILGNPEFRKTAVYTMHHRGTGDIMAVSLDLESLQEGECLWSNEAPFFEKHLLAECATNAELCSAVVHTLYHNCYIR